MRIQNRRTCRGAHRENLAPKKELTPPQNEFGRTRKQLAASAPIGVTAVQSLREGVSARNRSPLSEAPTHVNRTLSAAAMAHEVDVAFREERAAQTQPENL